MRLLKYLTEESIKYIALWNPAEKRFASTSDGSSWWMTTLGSTWRTHLKAYQNALGTNSFVPYYVEIKNNSHAYNGKEPVKILTEVV